MSSGPLRRGFCAASLITLVGCTAPSVLDPSLWDESPDARTVLIEGTLQHVLAAIHDRWTKDPASRWEISRGQQTAVGDMTLAVLHPDQALEPLDLIKYCEPRLPYFAVPRYVEFVGQLPTTENGKVQKYKLRERGITATTHERVPAATRVSQPPGRGLPA